MKKLLLPLPFLLCLLLLLLPVFADDDVRVEEYDGFTYAYDAETYTLTISGEGCVKLNKAFNRNSVRRLVFSEGITEIRNFCIRSLQEVVLPSTLTVLGDQAFTDCISLKSIVIPESVTKLDYAAFRACSALESIVIPPSVTEIPKECFTRCTRLREVRLPEGVTNIGRQAFDRCTALQTIELPETLKRIERFAFSQSGLTSIALRHVEEICGYAFRGCQSLTDIDWGDSLRLIGAGAFTNCTQLKKVVLPDTLERIGAGCFCGFLNRLKLQEATIPGNLKSVPNICFRETSLKQAILRDGVTEIQSQAFYACPYLERVVIPESVVTIAPDAFLQVVTFNKSDQSFVFDGTGDYGFHFYSQTTTIVGKSGSAADAYAAEHGLRFEDADTGAIRESSCGTAEVSDVTLEAYRRWAKIYGYTLRDPSGAVYDPKAERAQWLHVALLCGVSVLLIGIGSLGMLRRRKRK